MVNSVLGDQRSCELNLGANPLARQMRRLGGMLARAAAAELWPEARALDLVELLQTPPGIVARGARDVDLEQDGRHESRFAISGRGWLRPEWPRVLLLPALQLSGCAKPEKRSGRKRLKALAE